jgi:hypothetical protein
VADNDYGLGQFVGLISHSSIWESAAVFVIEDDSQDGADHVGAHRMPAFVTSPWARHGAVVHTRYDQDSVLHTIELILGLHPLSLFDALATPHVRRLHHPRRPHPLHRRPAAAETHPAQHRE